MEAKDILQQAANAAESAGKLQAYQEFMNVLGRYDDSRPMTTQEAKDLVRAIQARHQMTAGGAHAAY